MANTSDPKQSRIDVAIGDYYENLFDEDERLGNRSAGGRLEFQRTQEIVLGHIGAGRLLDVGGGTGVHALALQKHGFDVHLIDPVRSHVRVAAERGLNARVGDARVLDFDDNSFDAVLLLGPLYHLASVEDRRLALDQALRVTVPGGLIFAAALSRFIAFGAASLGVEVPSPYPPSLVALLERGRPPESLRFPAGHFHTPEELQDELEAVGLEVLDVVGVEGPAGCLMEELTHHDIELFNSAMLLARAAGSLPGIRDASPHLLGIARVPSPRKATQSSESFS